MSDDHSIRQLVEELSGAALRDLLRNVRHHTELRRRIALGELDERFVNAAYREYARREGPAYRQQAADLTLQYYSDLTELGAEYSERFYGEILADGLARRGNGVRANGDTAAGGPPTPADVEEVPVELHGPVGREVVTRFGLENSEQHPVRLTLDVGPCRGPDEATFIAPLSIQPADVVLEPGETRQVVLRLLLLPSVFVPGFLYRMTVNIRGAEEMRLLVSVWAEEPDVGLRPDPGAPPVPVTVPLAEPVTEPVTGPVTGERPVADEAGGVRFVVRCPDCGREFGRTTRSTRLYRHKTPDGADCGARVGRVRVDRREEAP